MFKSKKSLKTTDNSPKEIAETANNAIVAAKKIAGKGGSSYEQMKAMEDEMVKTHPDQAGFADAVKKMGEGKMSYAEMRMKYG